MSVLPDADDDAETDEESLPSSAKSQDESSGDEDSDSDSSEEEKEPAQRQPDPKATRHSKRSATSKAVSYSTKHHPQDASLPGYQHKARKLKEQAKASWRTLPSAQNPVVEIEASTGPTIRDTASKAKRAQPTGSRAIAKQSTKSARESSPRKKLRTLADDRGQPSPTKPTLQRNATETGSDMIQLLDIVAKTTTLDASAENTSAKSSNEEIASSEHEVASSAQDPSSTSTRGSHSAEDVVANHDQTWTFSNATGNDEIDETGVGLPSFGLSTADAVDHLADDGFMSMNHDDDSHGRHTGLPDTNLHDLIDRLLEESVADPGQENNSFVQNHSQDPNQHSIDHGLSSSTGSVDLVRQNSHPFNPPPSQFDEQFAITETQADSHKDFVTGGDSAKTINDNGNDPVSSDQSGPQDKAEFHRGAVEPDSIANGDNDLPSKDTPETILQGPVETSTMPSTDEVSSVLEEDLCKARLESNAEDSFNDRAQESPKAVLDQTPGGHDKMTNELENTKSTKRARSDEYPTPLSLHNSAISVRSRSADNVTKEVTDYDLDDDILHSFRSSQRTRSNEMMQSDPTTVGADED